MAALRENGNFPATPSSGSTDSTRAETKKLAVKPVQERQLYVRAEINGITFRCLTDTGSDCNLLPTNVATKYGFPFRKSDVKGAKGFNDQVFEMVTGQMKADISFGPSKEVKKADFYIVPGVNDPVVGIPILKDFNITVDVGAHQIMDKDSGLIINCSAVEISKIKATAAVDQPNRTPKN